jgi:hypothetical protein
MGRFSFKALIFAVSCTVGALALGGCIMEPIDLNTFLDDEKVKETLDKGAVIAFGSDADPNLKEGNGRITGLNPDKYYTIEEFEAEPTPIGPLQFVSSDGKRSPNLKDIGRVSSGEVSGLTNNHQYLIKSAQPLTGSVSFYYLSSGSTQTRTPVNGEVVMNPLPPGASDYLVFTPTLTAGISSYDIAKVPVSPAPAGPTEILPTMSPLMTAVFPGTVVDFVFYDKIINQLYVLRISWDDGGTPPPLTPDAITIFVSLGYSGDSSPTITTIPPFAQISTGTKVINLTVNNSSSYDTNSITWYLDGTLLGTGATYNLNFTQESQYNIIGKHKITVEATISNVPYSAEIEYEVTSP